MACAFPVSDLERSSVISERSCALVIISRAENEGREETRKEIFGGDSSAAPPSNRAFRAERGHYRDGCGVGDSGGAEKYVPTFYLVSAPPPRCRTERSVNLQSREPHNHYERDAFGRKSVRIREDRRQNVRKLDSLIN